MKVSIEDKTMRVTFARAPESLGLTIYNLTLWACSHEDCSLLSWRKSKHKEFRQTFKDEEEVSIFLV